MATFFLDYINGNDANDGLSFANRKKSFSNATTAMSPGDTLRVMMSDAPTSIGNATWTNKSDVVTLAAARTIDLYTDGAWTAAAAVTASTTTTRKQGSNASQLAIAGGFTTGIIGYYALPGSTDLSAYQKVSFWFRSSIDLDVSNIKINLCSDTVGAVPVNTAAITAGLPENTIEANTYNPITIDFGGALGSAIQSISLSADVDPGTPTIIIDNVFVTNDVSLQTAVGKHGAGDDIYGDPDYKWFPIESVVGDVVKIDGLPGSNVGTNRGYYGTAETCETFVAEPIHTILPPASTTDIHVINNDGTDGNLITISGGWNQTDMSTQPANSFTMYTALNGLGEMFVNTGRDYIRYERLISHRATQGFLVTAGHIGLQFSYCGIVGGQSTGFSIIASGTAATYNVFENCYATAVVNGMGATLGRLATITDCQFISNTGDGINVNSLDQVVLSGKNAFANNGAQAIDAINTDGWGINGGYFDDNVSIAILMDGCTGWRGVDMNVRNNGNSGLRFAQSPGNRFYNLTTSGNTTSGIAFIGPGAFENYFYNWSYDEANPVSGEVDYEDTKIISVKDDGVAGSSVIYTDGGRISTQTSVLHGSRSTGWKLQPTSAIRQAAYPLVHRVYYLPVTANNQVTASVWVQRDNTELTGVFRIRGGQIAGVASDVSDTTTGSANVDEELTFNFTPTEDGVVELEILAYGGTTRTLYWSDMSFTVSSSVVARDSDDGYARNGAIIAMEGGGGGGGQTSYVFG